MSETTLSLIHRHLIHGDRHFAGLDELAAVYAADSEAAAPEEDFELLL